MPRRGSIGHIVFAPVTFARWRGRMVWIPDRRDYVPSGRSVRMPDFYSICSLVGELIQIA